MGDSVSESNSVDNLLAGSAVETVTGTEIELKADQGALSRGQLLEINDIDGKLQVVSVSYTSTPSLSVLAVDVATSVSAQACITYDTGEFNEDAIILDDPDSPSLTISDVTAACRQVNIHFKDTGNNDPVSI